MHISAPNSRKFSTFPGIETIVSVDNLNDYIEMRSAQLTALSELICVEDFEGLTLTTKANAKWLVGSLSDEVSHLIQIVTNRRSA